MNGPRRVEELLAERATQGLAPAERGELQGLLAADPAVDPDGFDLAAAALALAMTTRVEPMPARIRQAVLSRTEIEVERVAATMGSLAPVADFAAERSRRLPAAVVSRRRSSRAPWLVTAAALALAVAGWWPRAETGSRTIVAASPLESVEGAADAIRWAWSGTEDPVVGAVGGEVVWSGAAQRGLLRLRGLAVNDPEVEQYQLWIFDRARDERFPVDGGVFDVSTEGEVLVPFEGRIEIGEPYLFVVTVEKPGGVVVSTRERIALLAQA